MHHVQGHLHLMQGLPAGANTRPKGGVMGVFVYTKTLLAHSHKSVRYEERSVRLLFPAVFALWKLPTERLYPLG